MNNRSDLSDKEENEVDDFGNKKRITCKELMRTIEEFKDKEEI